jgi:hypothetical protein
MPSETKSKIMKTSISLLLAGMFLLSVTSCRKDFNEIQEPTFEEMKFDGSFDWSTTKVVELQISGEQDALFTVTSADGKQRYHRAMFIAADKSYQLKLSLPKNLEQLKINNALVDIKSTFIVHKIS